MKRKKVLVKDGEGTWIKKGAEILMNREKELAYIKRKWKLTLMKKEPG